MRKKYICLSLFVPSVLVIVALILAYLEAYCFQNIFLLKIFSFLFTYGILLIDPLYLLLINIYFINKHFIEIKLVLLVTLLIFVGNAIVVSPKSILCYMGLKSFEKNDFDLFPTYVVVPAVIMLVGLGLYRGIKAVTRMARKDKNN